MRPFPREAEDSPVEEDMEVIVEVMEVDTEVEEADMVVTSLDKVTFMNLKGLFGPEAGREPMFPEAEMEKEAEPAAERPTLFSDEDDFWNK